MNKIEKPVNFYSDTLYLLDQRKLPHHEIFIEYKTIGQVYLGIKDMVVRGAPCIGFTGIFGMALGFKGLSSISKDSIRQMADYLIEARPTAVNLKYEVERVVDIVLEQSQNFEQIDKEKIYQKIVSFGHEQLELSQGRNLAMAKFAQAELQMKLSKKKYNILTHCNTGFLACGSMGTALGVIEYLGSQNKMNKVWVDETRPYLQGSRLTAYELNKLEIEHEIVVEGAASYLMGNGLVDAIFTGADRVVANGDTANKIGTSNLAIIAQYYKVPFYIVAPASTFDLDLKTGADIEVELRDANEILEIQGIRIAPYNSKAFNPSFDVTSGELITGIISEFGIASGDYTKTLVGISK